MRKREVGSLKGGESGWSTDNRVQSTDDNINLEGQGGWTPETLNLKP